VFCLLEGRVTGLELCVVSSGRESSRLRTPAIFVNYRSPVSYEGAFSDFPKLRK
jgi:hypothetical protein